MCGRFTLRQPNDVAERFQLQGNLEQPLLPRFNVAPSQPVPIIVEDDAERRLVLARWGLIPSWAKDATIGNRLINARGETLADKPSFRAALRSRRCLIPADGFFEWRRAANGAGRARRSTPYFFHRPDDALFAFAGLYERWRSPAGDAITSCTIVTTDANDVVVPIHDRMPVMLLPEHEELWLDPAAAEAGAWHVAVQPYPDELLECWEVSPRVNQPGNDAPDLVAPVA